MGSMMQVDAALRIIDGLLVSGHKGLIQSRNERWTLGVTLEPLPDEIARLVSIQRSLRIEQALAEIRREQVIPYSAAIYFAACNQLKSKRESVEEEITRLGEVLERRKIKNF